MRQSPLHLKKSWTVKALMKKRLESIDFNRALLGLGYDNGAAAKCYWWLSCVFFMIMEFVCF